MAQQRYLVVIGDLISSRDAADRGELQRRLAQCLLTLNKPAPEGLASPYTITLGDEFQAVRTRSDRLWFELMHIQKALLPARVRFSLGLGEIATPINREQALGMDGKAFYHARDGMERLKGQARTLAITGLADADQRWADALLQVIGSMSAKWRANRYEILCRLLMDQTPADIAAALEISIQAVYQNIRDGELELIMALFALLDTLLEPSFDHKD
ncbi:MAG: SatD family protein [Natronospirillum sp.]|uniref:SatD family protein n=1 Tax=Natronospirillum sp. TaxID=2812955 RepID=UPI0025F797BE|nr:SatD family protein [Natronospirillum sp.]MCH8550931.1 SatD family protein [Natronospirillum sp.]